MPYNLNHAVLKMNITATETMSNTNQSKVFKHEYFFHALDLNKVNLVDPGQELAYNEETGNFTVQATKGVAAWAWLDIPPVNAGKF
jgi:beta-mannosidase